MTKCEETVVLPKSTENRLEPDPVRIPGKMKVEFKLDFRVEVFDDFPTSKIIKNKKSSPPEFRVEALDGAMTSKIHNFPVTHTK